MSRKCVISGKAVLVGHKVSHSNRKTKKRFLPNLKYLSIKSEILDKSFRLRLSTNSIRTIEHNDGLDNYLISTPNSKLSKDAMIIKKEILKFMEKPLENA